MFAIRKKTFFDWLFRRGGVQPPAVDNSPGGDFKPEMLVFGLGNPGGKYAGTRHNIGFEVVDGLVGASAPREYCGADCREAVFGAGGKPVLLVKPLTYMNLSGDAVGALVVKYGLTPTDCLVIVDDFNIPLGKVRFRKDGSAGGHNGLKSITAAIGPDYPRLRVGIGPLPVGVTVIDFVLGRFDAEESKKVKEIVKTAAEAVVFMIENGIEKSMNRYNS